MRCRECGANSRVLETRDEPDLARTRRTRLCDNQHRFSTFEVYQTIATRAGKGYTKQVADGVQKLAERAKRDHRICVAYYLHKEPARSISKRLPLSYSAVRAILKRGKQRFNVQPG